MPLVNKPLAHSEVKRPESVLVVVYSVTQEVLCLLRSDYPDFWQSVTGSLLEGEQPQEAALRELYEETGLCESDGTLVDCQHSAYFTIYPQWLHRYAPGVTTNLEHVFCFVMRTPQHICISHEHTKYCWLPKEEAIRIMASPSNQSAIKNFVK